MSVLHHYLSKALVRFHARVSFANLSRFIDSINYCLGSSRSRFTGSGSFTKLNSQYKRVYRSNLML